MYDLLYLNKTENVSFCAQFLYRLPTGKVYVQLFTNESVDWEREQYVVIILVLSLHRTLFSILRIFRLNILLKDKSSLSGLKSVSFSWFRFAGALAVLFVSRFGCGCNSFRALKKVSCRRFELYDFYDTYFIIGKKWILCILLNRLNMLIVYKSMKLSVRLFQLNINFS